MKSLQTLLVLGLLSSFQLTNAQFTDDINSNRPGRSMMAFSVGKSVFQTETGINYVNEKFMQLTKFSRDELIGADYRIFKHPDIKDKIFEDFDSLLDLKNIFHHFLVSHLLEYLFLKLLFL